MNTFASVDPEAKQTLSDWTVKVPEGGLWSETSVRVNTFDTAGQIAGDFCYLDDVQGGMFGVEPGWYTTDSVFEWSPVAADDQIIPFGMGVQIGSDCGAVVTFAGQVLAEDASFAVNDAEAGGYTWTGNCTPVNRTLNDITVTPPDGGLWSETSVRVNTFDAEGQIAGDYCYLDDVQSGMFGVEPGWYTTDSVFEWSPVAAGTTEILSGEMFQIGSDCGATITIPSAL